MVMRRSGSRVEKRTLRTNSTRGSSTAMPVVGTVTWQMAVVLESTSRRERRQASLMPSFR
jgi:hypothetical protein